MINPEVDTTPSIAVSSQPRQRPWLWVLLSAALMTASFPPLDLGFLAWFAAVPLLAAAGAAPRFRSAFGRGYVLGLLHWGCTVTWVGTTVSGWVHSPIGWVAWAGLVSVKSLWYGAIAGGTWLIWTKVFSREVGRVCSTFLAIVGPAALWIVVDALRCQSSVAMPWSLIAYTQYTNLPIIQILDITGMHGVTLALILANSGFALWWLRRCFPGSFISKEPSKHSDPPAVNLITTNPLLPLLVPAGVCILLMLFYGFVKVRQPYPGDPMTVTAMQTVQSSFSGEAVDPTLSAQALSNLWNRRAAEMGRRPAASGSELMVWPESATVYSPALDRETALTYSGLAQATGAWQVFGSSHTDEQNRGLNSAFIYSPDGKLSSRYDKHWLVPFGEWVPMRSLLPFPEFFKFPPDSGHGSLVATVKAGRVNMAVLICYESVFPVVGRRRTAAGANLILNITNDSWSGKTAEARQHIAMVVFRAVENRRWLVSAATTGVTGFVEPSGKLHDVPEWKEEVTRRRVRLRSDLSIYTRTGEWLPCLAALTLVGITLLLRKSPERAS